MWRVRKMLMQNVQVRRGQVKMNWTVIDIDIDNIKYYY